MKRLRLYFLIVVTALAANAPAASNSGYGPEISVPRELAKPAPNVKHSVVDQTAQDVRVKSAGEGMGIGRIVMMLTGQPSIRDVLLFPLMRPEE